MISPSNVLGKNGLNAISVVLLTFISVFYFIIVAQYQKYPALSATLIIVLAFSLTWLIMSLGAQLDRTRRQQQRDLDTLIQRVLTGHPGPDLTKMALDAIKNIFLVDSVEIIDGKNKKPHFIEIKIPARRNSLYLRIGAKNNGFPWKTYEIRALQLLVDSLGATLSLEIEKKMAENNLKSLRNRVVQNSKILEELKLSLNKREWEHTEKFDELAHELKNPIALLSFSVQGADQTGNNSDQELIISEINWMRKYVDHVLDLARLRAQKTEIKNANFNLFELTKDAIYETREIVNDKLIQLSPANRSQKIHADEHLLYSSLRNLLVVATNLSTKDIDIKISKEENNARLSILFGLELSQVTIAKDFLENKQVGYDHRRAGLTGLELEIARSVVAKSGGNISVNSDVATRTKIEINFPIKKEACR